MALDFCQALESLTSFATTLDMIESDVKELQGDFITALCSDLLDEVDTNIYLKDVRSILDYVERLKNRIALRYETSQKLMRERLPMLAYPLTIVKQHELVLSGQMDSTSYPSLAKHRTSRIQDD